MLGGLQGVICLWLSLCPNTTCLACFMLMFNVASSGLFMICRDYRSKVDAVTDFACARLFELGHVIRHVLMRMPYVQQKFDLHVCVVLSKLYSRQAFRQVPVDVVEPLPCLGT